MGDVRESENFTAIKITTAHVFWGMFKENFI